MSMTGWHVTYATVAWVAFGFALGFVTGLMHYFHALRREQETTKFLSADSIGDEKMPLERILRKNAESVDEFGGEAYFPPTVYSELEDLSGDSEPTVGFWEKTAAPEDEALGKMLDRFVDGESLKDVFGDLL